jgi:hypothetical protein
LTAISAGASPACCQARFCATAVLSTHSPIGRIRPLASAIGMNSDGAIMPSCGCVQRSKASQPVTRRVLSSICGW